MYTRKKMNTSGKNMGGCWMDRSSAGELGSKAAWIILKSKQKRMKLRISLSLLKQRRNIWNELVIKYDCLKRILKS